MGLSRPRQVLKVLLVLFGLTMAVLSLSEVKYGFTWEDVKRQGVDVVVALDVSDSMLVEMPRPARASRGWSARGVRSPTSSS